MPRLQAANLEQNLKPVAVLKQLAAAKGCSLAQFAVAWLLSRGEDIITIVRISRPERLADNLQALDITLSTEEQVLLEDAFAPGVVLGERYP